MIAATGHAWPHCMCITSRRTSTKYGRLYLFMQSWTPQWTSGPYFLDEPVGSFWISEKTSAASSCASGTAARWSAIAGRQPVTRALPRGPINCRIGSDTPPEGRS